MPNATVCFSAPKTPPAPNGQYEQAAATHSRCVPVIAFTPQSRRCDPAVINPARRDQCGFDDVIDPHGTGLAQYPPTRDHDPCQPQRHWGRHRRTRCKANTGGPVTPGMR